MAKVFLSKVGNSLSETIEDGLAYIDWQEVIPSGARIFFKPNLTYPSPQNGVTTTPEFIEAVLNIFSGHGYSLFLGESDGGYRGWPAEMAFKSHGLPEICEKYNTKLVNLSKMPFTKVPMNLSKGKVDLNLPSILLHDIDVLITLPVPKVHQITTMSCAIKNQWGCIPDGMRLTNHPYFDEMILEINRLTHAKLAIADGKFFLNKTGPMVGGEPVAMNMILASDSLGALDYTICKLMGIDLENVRYLRFAQRNGWIPEGNKISFNKAPENFPQQNFYLHRTVRNKIVKWAFDRPYAINLFWNSKVASLLHKLLYSIVGNPVKDEVENLICQYQRSS